jgi:integrase
MSVRIKAAKYDTPTARIDGLRRRKKPYWFGLGRKGIRLGYRRNKTAGTWSVESIDTRGNKWTKAFALADDHDPSDGVNILTFDEACARAKALAGVSGGTPITVDQALVSYRALLVAENRDPKNETRIRKHLTPAFLGKFVADLGNRDIKTVCDGMQQKGLKPDTIVRTMKPLRAALNQAAFNDRRITNAEVWKGERNVEPDNNWRRLALMNDVISDIIAAAYEVDDCLGQLVEVLAQTGARVSQVARMRVCDLKPEGILIVPPSNKGKGKRPPPARVEVPPALCAELLARGRRPATEVLLLQSNGERWNSRVVWKLFRKAVIGAGLDPDNYRIEGHDEPMKISSYALRHSHIVDQLEKGLEPQIVALMHDTSRAMIDRHYARHADDRARERLRAAVTDLSATRRASDRVEAA